MSGSQLIEESGRGKLVTKNKKKERGKEMLVTKYQNRIRERKAGHKISNTNQRERSSTHSESQVLTSPVHTSMDLDAWSCFAEIIQLSHTVFSIVQLF